MLSFVLLRGVPVYFSDPLFRFQSYLSGAETVGSQPLDARSHVLDIEAVWDDYRGDGITVAVVAGRPLCAAGVAGLCGY